MFSLWGCCVYAQLEQIKTKRPLRFLSLILLACFSFLFFAEMHWQGGRLFLLRKYNFRRAQRTSSECKLWEGRKVPLATRFPFHCWKKLGA